MTYAWSVFLLALSLALTFVHSSFFLTTPANLVVGRNHSVWAYLHRFQSPTTLTATLRLPNVKAPLMSVNRTLFTPGAFELNFQVPEELRGQEGVILGLQATGGLSFSDNQLMNVLSGVCQPLIQTDKAVYKPGQTVNIRILTMNIDRQILLEPLDISVQDNSGNLIMDWKNTVNSSGVVTKELELSDQPPLGEWRVMVRCSCGSGSKTFKVEKYVLPRFEVTLETVPSFVVKGRDRSFKVIVRARYTYGKRVAGRAFVKANIGGTSFDQQLVQLRTGEGEETEVEFKLRGDTGALRGYTVDNIDIEANVTEEPAQVWATGSASLPLYSHPFRINFLPRTTNIIRPGLAVIAQVSVTDNSGQTPAAVNQKMTLSLGEQSVEVTVPPSGIVEHNFTYNTYQFIMARLQDQSQVHFLIPYESLNGVSMRVLCPRKTAAVGDTFHFSIETSATASMPVNYMVLAKGSVVLARSYVTNTQAANVSREFSFQVTSEMSPEATLVAVGMITDREREEIVADGVRLIFTEPVPQVQPRFSADIVKAGEPVELTVNAEPNALVCILAVDKSVQLLGTGNDITTADILNAQRKLDNPGGDSSSSSVTPYAHLTDHNELGSNAHAILKNAGLKYWTDFSLRAPVYMEKEMAVAMDKDVFARGNQLPMAAGFDPTGVAPITHVRQLFPETWLWLDSFADAQGKARFSTLAPDTITEWRASAFAVSSRGQSRTLALTALPATVTVYQDFFISMRLPYSLKMGETFELMATLFNYLDTDLDVQVTLDKSTDFSVVLKMDQQEVLRQEEVRDTVRVLARTPRAVQYWIKPARVGDLQISLKAQAVMTSPNTPSVSDHVIRSITVVPQGVVQQHSTGLVLRLSQSKPAASLRVALAFPPDPVPQSRRVEVFVTGDVMGATLKGLHRLIMAPFGCGEQNMITLVPNIFVAKYLKAANKLEPEVEVDAKKNMLTGYQRELTFKHTEFDIGAFSAFGNSDERGSTWLTAFVLKSFAQASAFISVDLALFEDAIIFLGSTQQPDGSFREVGRVIHTEMQSGNAQGSKLTAFVLVSILEVTRVFELQSVNGMMIKAARYLSAQALAGEVFTLYDKAVLAYALTLLGDTVKADALLTDMLGSGQTLPWTGGSTEEEEEETLADEKPAVEPRAPHWVHVMPTPPALASAVETAGYVVLTLLARQRVADARDIVTWLLKQQSPTGGFRSTQDTVMALQALAEYAEAVIQDAPPNIQLRVSGVGPSPSSLEYSLNPQTALRLHALRLPDDTDSVEINATGLGFAIVKVSWQYNVIKTDMTPSQSDVTIKARTSAVKVDSERALIHTCVSCAEDVGMAVVSVGVLSGFTPDLPDLPANSLVRRQEVKDNQVHLYLDRVPSKETCLDVTMVVSDRVENVQPAEVKAFAYYSPDIMTEGMYSLARGGAVNCRDCVSDCPPECTSNSALPSTSLSPLNLLLTLLSTLLLSLLASV